MEVTNRAEFMSKYDNGGYLISASRKGNGRIRMDEMNVANGSTLLSDMASYVLSEIQSLAGVKEKDTMDYKKSEGRARQYLDDAVKAGLSIEEAYSLLSK